MRSKFYYGWIVVGMAFLANFFAFGLTYLFGVFFKPLATEFHWSRTIIVGAFALYAVGHDALAFFAGVAVDRFGPKVVIALAGLCLGLSMILMGQIESIWELYFYFGIVFGIGVAGTYTPMMTTVSGWFIDKSGLGLAMGLAAAGIGSGSLILSPFTAWLITSFGWRYSYVLIGLLCWVVFVPIVIFLKRRPVLPKKQDTTISTDFTFVEAIRTGSFWFLGLTWLFGAMAIFAPMMHLVPLCTDMGISLVAAGTIMGLYGGASVVGRIAMGLVSDKIGRKQAMLICFLSQTLILVWLIFAKNLWSLSLFSIVFGFSSGGWAALCPAICTDYFGFRSGGKILGMVVLLAGIGVGIGPLVGGYIFDVTHSYYYMIWMSILASLAAFVCSSLLVSPVRKNALAEL